MPSFRSAVVSVLLLSTGALADHFQIRFTRFGGDACQHDSQIDKGNAKGDYKHIQMLEANDKCFTWPDHVGFGSGRYGFVSHGMWWDKPERYGTCTMDLYEKPGCQGQNVGRHNDVGKYAQDPDHTCFGRFFGEHDDAPHLAKSLVLRCTKSPTYGP